MPPESNLSGLSSENTEAYLGSQEGNSKMVRIAIFSLVVLLISQVDVLVEAQHNRGNAKKNVTVGGYLVDEKNRPIPDGDIQLFFESDCKGCTDQLFPSSKTGKSGSFILGIETSARSGLLFIDDSPPGGFFPLLFHAVIAEERGKIDLLRGIRINLTRASIGMGKIPAPYRYGRLIIALPPKFSSAPDYPSNLHVSLSDSKGNVAYTGTVPKTALSENGLNIMLALPAAGNGTIWNFTFENLSHDHGEPSIKFRILLKKLVCQKVSFIGTKWAVSPCS